EGQSSRRVPSSSGWPSGAAIRPDLSGKLRVSTRGSYCFSTGLVKTAADAEDDFRGTFAGCGTADPHDGIQARKSGDLPVPLSPRTQNAKNGAEKAVRRTVFLQKLGHHILAQHQIRENHGLPLDQGPHDDPLDP